MKSWSRRSTTALGAVVAGLFASATAVRAAELSYGVDAGVGHTDNVARTADDEQAETIASIGGQLRLDHESSRLRANVATRMEYREYLDNTYDGELAGNLLADGTLDIVEERISWALTDTFGQTTQNQFAAATPDNRENVNYLSTGPNLSLPLGSRNMLIVHGRYKDVSYEDSDLGSERLRGELMLQRDLSDASKLALNATTERVTFDDETNFADFDTDEAFLSYSIDAARTTMSFDAGVTEITLGDESDSGWLGRLKFKRRASSSLSVGLELGHEFSDAGDAFANLQVNQPGSTDPVPVQQTAAPFESNYGTVFGQFSRNRTGIQLRAGYYDESYETQPLFDRTRITLDLNLSRTLNSVLSGNFRAGYSSQKFETLDRKFADLTATLGLRWNVSRTAFLSVDYQYLNRNDDNSAADYRANELWVRFGYLVGTDVASGGFGGP